MLQKAIADRGRADHQKIANAGIARTMLDRYRGKNGAPCWGSRSAAGREKGWGMSGGIVNVVED